MRCIKVEGDQIEAIIGGGIQQDVGRLSHGSPWVMGLSRGGHLLIQRLDAGKFQKICQQTLGFMGFSM